MTKRFRQVLFNLFALMIFVDPMPLSGRDVEPLYPLISTIMEEAVEGCEFFPVIPPYCPCEDACLPCKEVCDAEAEDDEEEDGLAIDRNCSVDLRNPAYCEGKIYTDCGGVITGPDLRIQAERIVYTGRNPDGERVSHVEAECGLIVEFGDYVFVGQKLEYDFKDRSGVIYYGKTMVEPWYFGGDIVFLHPDGSYTIYNATVTTSPCSDPDWLISVEEATLYDQRFLCAKNVKFRFMDVPIFWLPSMSADLDSIFDSPVRYNVKWGSRQGHRFGLSYELFSTANWKTFLRLDYRLKRGLGGGFETSYRSCDRKTWFESINYAARDSSIIHPKQRFRYRFQGKGESLLLDDKVSVRLSYDKISDIDMPTDYNDRGLELDTAGRTELLITRKECSWIANLNTRVRINNFQTVKQELPTLETSWRPFNLASTGIVGETVVKASYLDFVYGNNQLYDHDYSSSRFEVSPLFYRHFYIGQVNATPEAGAVAIAYSNSPGSGSKYLALGKLGCTLNMDFWRHYGNFKHVMTPYVKYDYYTSPTVSPNSHYIFDIEDGWSRLDMMRFGMTQSLYRKISNGCVMRQIYADVYANAFFDTKTFAQAIPKVYADVVFNSFSCLKHCVWTAWNFNQNLLDYFNVRTEWTVNADLAFAFEYRHRSAFDWRKADHTNFILDSFRSVSQLRRSQLSDRRDTVLFHMFYRFHPCWALQVESRSGWNRMFEPSYNEYEFDLIGTLPSAWNIKLSYQHKEDDDRVSVYMTIGMKRPDFGCSCSIIPFLGF